MSAYYTGGGDNACVVTADNFGDGYSAKVYDACGPAMRFLRGVSALRSPGQFYGEMAQIAGIAPLLAGKLTGMAASGDPQSLRGDMAALFDVEDGGRTLASTFSWGRRASRPPFSVFASVPPADLAAAAQRRFEETIAAFVAEAVRETGRRRLALAGGCFANVRVNQRVAELPGVESIWIHPAMTDQGISFGAALASIARRRALAPLRWTMFSRSRADDRTDARGARCGRPPVFRSRRTSRPPPPDSWRTAKSWPASRARWNTARARSATAACFTEPRMRAYATGSTEN
ncbi:MAG: hypothetical protein M5R36_00200 [Deltaproteobacteria bacterium]|nr:hypothetical protein [Deltaproteobacteria bacterium]